jgi:dTDP-4-dehydrorhamnose 3,5-epimerase
MARLADEGVSPSVVNDQFGRLTFTTDLAAATKHLLEAQAEYGVYNVTCSGPVVSWAALAREVFRLVGRSPDDVSEVATAEWAAGKVVSPRPRHSALALEKIEATGFAPRDQMEALEEYLGVEG